MFLMLGNLDELVTSSLLFNKNENILEEARNDSIVLDLVILK